MRAVSSSAVARRLDQCVSMRWKQLPVVNAERRDPNYSEARPTNASPTI